MGQHRVAKRISAGTTPVLILVILLGLLPGPAWAGTGPADREEPPASGALQGATKLAGAYLFYWWLFPNDPDGVNPYNWVAFHPPGLVQENPTCFHGSPWCLAYQGDTYNDTYYNVTQQRWWEWQFRDMVEAGLDIAFLISWDGASLLDPGDPYRYFMTLSKRITAVDDALVPALDTLGNPLRVALYDDTWSEHHQWCLDNGFPLPACDTDLGQYPMSLTGYTGGRPNTDYFWYKWQTFHDTVPRRMWATHNGLPIEQGGRPLILMWHGWFFYDLGASSETMCRLKGLFYDRYGVEPFLLPDVDWGQPSDSDLRLDSMCPAPHAQWHAIDGWSNFAMAGSGVGARVFSNPANGYTTAYLGPGMDACAYSGPYGPVPNPPAGCGATTYYARWWDVGTAADPVLVPGQEKQGLYYEKSWDEVNSAVNLVVVESWNELCEGTAISRLESYIAPDLTWCIEHGYNGNFGQCPMAHPFNETPHGPSGGAWTDRYWIRLTRERVDRWRATPAPTTILVDNNNDGGLCPDQGSFNGNWWLHSAPLYPHCVDAQYTPRGVGGEVQWVPAIDSPGVYDVYAWWQQDAGGSQDASFRLAGSGGSIARVDQSRGQDAGYWNYLGRASFSTGSGVALSSVATTGEVVLADAVRLVYRGAYTPPPMTFHSYLPLLVRPGASEGLVPPPRESYPPPLGATPPPTPAPPSYPPPPTGTPIPPPTPSPSPTPTSPPGDTQAPSSAVEALPPYQNQPAGFAVTWSGADPGGSGIAMYDVQVRDGSGAWTDWLPHTSLHSWWFMPVQDGHTYYLRSRAHDRAGNVEPWPSSPAHDTFTTVDLTAPSSHVQGLPAYSRASFPVTWSGQDSVSGVASYDVQVCQDNCTGPTPIWSDWLVGTTQTTATFQNGQDGRTYSFRSRAHDRAGNSEAWPAGPDASTLVDTYAPTSAVAGLPPYSRAPLSVTWSGQDSASGIATYDVQYCLADCTRPAQAVWTDWLVATPATQGLYQGADGPVHFRCRARDRAGNVEDYPLVPDAGTEIDSLPPSSQVQALPPYSGPACTVSWSGQDALSGIAGYDIQVCAGRCDDPGGDEGHWSGWLTGTTALSGTFGGGIDGQAYSFRSRARDRAGNVEAWPQQPDATTIVDKAPPASQVTALPPFSLDAFTVTWSGQDAASGIAFFDVQTCRGDCAAAGSRWSDWLTRTTALSATFSGGEDSVPYAFRCRAVDRVGNAEPWPLLPDAATTVDTAAPISKLAPLPLYSRAVFTVTWLGQDAGCGVAGYDVQVRTLDLGPVPDDWQDWLSETTSLAAPFTGTHGQRVAFRVRARDVLGNLEEYPPEATVSTVVDAAGPQTWLEPPQLVDHSSYLVRWGGHDVPAGLSAYDVYLRDDALESWELWQQAVTATQAIFTATAGHTYHLCVRGVDRAGNDEAKDCPGMLAGWPIASEAVISAAPVSRVDELPPSMPTPSFHVRWSTWPQAAAVDVQFMDEADGQWRDWLHGVRGHSARFTGQPGHGYAFRSRAVDAAGQPLEPWPWSYDARTVVPEGPHDRNSTLPPDRWTRPARRSAAMAPPGARRSRTDAV